MNKRLFLLGWVAFCLTLISSQPAYAYIDPGTGSMLFSVVLGCCTVLFYLFNSFWIKLKQILFTQKDLVQNSIPYVIYSEGSQYYSVYKPIIDEFEKRQIPLLYYTSQPNDKFLDEEYNYIKCKYIGNEKKAFLKLAFLKADICLMTIPQLDVLQLKRSKYVKHYSHIFHSITMSMDYRLFSLDYYDSVLCDAEFQIPLIRELEQKRNLPAKDLPVVGSTYMDYLNEKIEHIEHNYTITIAPSWGIDGLLTKYGEKVIEEALKSEARIIIRPHPQSLKVEKKLIDYLQDKYKENEQITWDFNPDNMQTLAQTDILITDFSSVMFDYAFLFNKPFIYSISSMNNEIYDMSDLDEIPIRYQLMKEIGQELTEENIGNLKDIISKLSNNPEIQKRIQNAKNLTWMHQGNAAKNIVDYLVKKQKEISKC